MIDMLLLLLSGICVLTLPAQAYLFLRHKHCNGFANGLSVELAGLALGAFGVFLGSILRVMDHEAITPDVLRVCAWLLAALGSGMVLRALFRQAKETREGHNN